MIDYKEIPYNDDTWELFARDFLLRSGFFIESSPDRGADGGKDILITEDLIGLTNKYKFKWLVSCKHFATSGSSVNETDEMNLLERLSAFKADGFIGFYSTLPSSGWNTRLNALRDSKLIKDFKIYDSKLLENMLLTNGYSDLVMRYMPISYVNLKPIHNLTSEYVPIQCEVCDKDLIKAMYQGDRNSVLAEVSRYEEGNNIIYIDDMYCACKGECDAVLNKRMAEKGCITSWKDLSDLTIPLEYLRYNLTLMNILRAGKTVYSDVAFEKEKNIIIAMAQKSLRYTTESERRRVAELIELSPF